jgi:hypothetical protein
MAGALVLAACQSASETLTEKALEQIEGVEGVDFDVDSGKISVETDDGEKIVIGGGEVPDGFGIALPNGGDVMSVFTADESANVTLSYVGADYDTIVAFFEDWTSGQSEEWSKSTSSFSNNDGETIMTTTFTSDGNFISVSNNCFTLDENVGEFESVCVTAVTS